eukprot:gene5790-5853_t
MPGRLAGKTAFMTACAQGIGRATALAFAAEGAKERSDAATQDSHDEVWSRDSWVSSLRSQ